MYKSSEELSIPFSGAIGFPFQQAHAIALFRQANQKLRHAQRSKIKVLMTWLCPR